MDIFQDSPPATDEELAEFEADDEAAKVICYADMRKLEAEFAAAGRVFAWLASELAIDKSDDSLHWPWLDDPVQPIRRTIRFSLIGGGQLTHTEQFHFVRSEKDGSICRFDDGRPMTFGDHESLIVTTHDGGDCHRHKGSIKTAYGGKGDGWYGVDAVVFGGNTPQGVADRVARTLALTSDWEPDNFYALLDSSTGCAICNRPLRDEISKLIGVGPDCARQNGIPHNIAAANQRLKLRRELLGEETLQ